MEIYSVLQGFKVLFQRRISTTPTARKNRFFRSVGVVFFDRTHFFCERTQKLTRQIEVESHTSQMPSRKAVSVRSKTGPYILSSSSAAAAAVAAAAHRNHFQIVFVSYFSILKRSYYILSACHSNFSPKKRNDTKGFKKLGRVGPTYPQMSPNTNTMQQLGSIFQLPSATKQTRGTTYHHVYLFFPIFFLIDQPW